MSKNEISHAGRIVEITPEITTVEIVSSSACSGCHARSLCSVAEEKDKVICVPTGPFTVYKVGDAVNACVKRTMGMKAVWISYVLPLIVLMSFILILSSLAVGEFLTGAVSICAVGIYYLVIYLFRDRLANEYVFYIKQAAPESKLTDSSADRIKEN